MDSEGIDLAVLFPSVAFYLPETSDPALTAALCRAYNDWLADYCRAAPSRLFGVAMLPLADIDASIHELERATEKARLPRRLRAPESIRRTAHPSPRLRALL